MARLPKPRRGRTTATECYVRGRKMDERLETGPPRLVNPAANRARQTSGSQGHPAAGRFAGRLRRHLRNALGPKSARFANH